MERLPISAMNDEVSCTRSCIIRISMMLPPIAAA